MVFVDWYPVQPLLWSFVVGAPGTNKSSASSILSTALTRIEGRLNSFFKDKDLKKEQKPIERSFWTEYLLFYNETFSCLINLIRNVNTEIILQKMSENHGTVISCLEDGRLFFDLKGQDRYEFHI